MTEKYTHPSVVGGDRLVTEDARRKNAVGVAARWSDLAAKSGERPITLPRVKWLERRDVH